MRTHTVMQVIRTVVAADPAVRANLLAALAGPGAPAGIVSCFERDDVVTVSFDDEVTRPELIDDLITIEIPLRAGLPAANRARRRRGGALGGGRVGRSRTRRIAHPRAAPGRPRMIPYLGPFSFSFGIPDAIDIVATSVLIYYLLLLIRGTRAVQIVLGLLTLVIVLGSPTSCTCSFWRRSCSICSWERPSRCRSCFSRSCAVRSSRSAAGGSFAARRPTMKRLRTELVAHGRRGGVPPGPRGPRRADRDRRSNGFARIRRERYRARREALGRLAAGDLQQAVAAARRRGDRARSADRGRRLFLTALGKSDRRRTPPRHAAPRGHRFDRSRRRRRRRRLRGNTHGVGRPRRPPIGAHRRRRTFAQSTRSVHPAAAPHAYAQNRRSG